MYSKKEYNNIKMDIIKKGGKNITFNHNKRKKLKLILEKKNEEIHIIKDDEKWCLNCRKLADHGIKNCPNKKIVCMNCNHRGHYKYDCYIYKNACYRCLSYGKIIYQDECELHKDITVCGCIIANAENTKLLLVKGKMSECWGFPKGASEPHETLAECAVRETLEETGMEVRITEMTKKETINSITYYYITIPEDLLLSYDNVIDKNEIMEIKWFNIYDLMQHNITNINKSVKIYINNLYST
jgi:8-oxo-dGTP pyrophosphatase MutT (NUDIX family)